MRVKLNGPVVRSDSQWLYDWFEIEAFSPATVRRALAENPQGEELVFEINSPGGSVFSGSEIYTVLRSAKGVSTRAEIQSVAASAASYLCLGCDTVVISPVGQMMVHLPSTSTEGDRTEHLRSVQLLDSTREAILNAYELRAGDRADRGHLRQLMTAQTWLTAQEAVDLGLADGIMFSEASVPAQMVASVGAGVRAVATGSGALSIDEASLLARYEALVRCGAAPAEGHPVETTPAPEAKHVPAITMEVPPEDGAEIPSSRDGPDNWADWRTRARLDMEKSRFAGVI